MQRISGHTRPATVHGMGHRTIPPQRFEHRDHLRPCRALQLAPSQECVFRSLGKGSMPQAAPLKLLLLTTSAQVACPQQNVAELLRVDLGMMQGRSQRAACCRRVICHSDSKAVLSISASCADGDLEVALGFLTAARELARCQKPDHYAT